jgi:putative DNA methylase
MKKKLIEVALPLEAINKASAREKSIRQGHPSTLHLWWARRPLAVCRAVLFASLVDDPGDETERQRLFKLIEDLVQWENVNNKTLLEQARTEILKSTGGNPPPIYDPFCGGGSIPLEAQRLGLEVYASDLNPVAVLITKALVEIPYRFRDHAPINPDVKKNISAQWPGASGLASDIRYYGSWMEERAQERIGHFYPPVRLKDGSDATVVAWIWARTVQCPNPACRAIMPLVSNFNLSTKKGKETWVEPVLNAGSNRIEFRVATGTGKPPAPPKLGRGAKFNCLHCGLFAPEGHIKAEGRAGRMGTQLMAIVAGGPRGRTYVEPQIEHVRVAENIKPMFMPDQELAHDPRNIWCREYGLTTFADLFTARQLVALTTLSDLVSEARSDALKNGASPSYADALATYLGLLVSRLANSHCTIALWSPSRDQSKNAFSRQAIPMTWDFAEVNPFAGAAGGISETAENMAGAVASQPTSVEAHCFQLDAASACQPAMYSTDPPYYDNIGYADLSDFFYVWLRRSIGSIEPELFSTLLVPKKQELIASPYRHGDKEKAQEFFETGFGKVVAQMRLHHRADYPLTLFYAFRQSESEIDGQGDAPTVSSTGWQTMLEGLLKAGFQIDGTWPMRSERSARSIAIGTNALASSILLVCRQRSETAPITNRKDFLAALKRELPLAVRTLQQGNVAPVDLQQASIGPGMAVFSRYQKVREIDGTPMKVRTALALINQMLDEALSEQESDFDPDTRFALAWFEQFQFDEGKYGQAEVLATAKAISVSSLADAGIAYVRAGNVRLLKRSELPDDWNPNTDKRLTVWEATQHLIRELDHGAANLAGRLGVLGETARELAYRLYTICERKGWAEEAQAYNGLVVNWPDIRRHAEEFTLQ